MRIQRCRAVLLGLVLAVAVVPAAIADDMMMMSRSSLISGVLPTVVNITTEVGLSETASMDVAAKSEASPRTLRGSGFIIDPAGYKAYVAERETAFRKELARQQAGGKL